VNSMQQQLESKIGQAEAQFALANKLDKAQGDQIGAEVEGLQQRVGALNERATEAESHVSDATSSFSQTSSRLEELASQVDTLVSQVEGGSSEVKARTSDIHDLVTAVRAHPADAEMRCALDEREIEFLWAAPSHIYGQHGWRDNNGSVSERTPYPVGNFKMGVRHGTEGNARDVLQNRKKWLNSITVGKRQSEEMEAQGVDAGSAQAGAPVRLPALDEFSRYNSGPRPGSPRTAGILGPAHSLIGTHSASVGGGVGLPSQKAYHAAAQYRNRVIEGTI